MNRKNLLIAITLAVFICGTVSVAMAAIPDCADAWWSACQDYNRPNPRSNADPGFGGYRTYDYVPQELGIYDTFYGNLGETDCRACHGNSLANRHHFSPTVIEFGQCTPCHDPDPNAPGGVVVTRDCTTAGCHSVGDITGPNGWHHNTDMSQGNACVVCHDRNIIAEVTTFQDFEMYPPTVVTPTPFSCENCHWYQDVKTTTEVPKAITGITNAASAQVAITAHGYAANNEIVLYGLTGSWAVLNGQQFAVVSPTGGAFYIADSNGNPVNTTTFGAYPGGAKAMRVNTGGATPTPTAGHPSDFNHLDYWGNNVGYKEYGKPIMQNATNHMMYYMSNITAGSCYRCHGMDPNDTSWTHTNEELIRYCEVCHDMYTLHTIYGHVGYDNQGHIVYPGAGYPQDAAGWVATGFHVAPPEGNNDNPFDYTTFNCNGSPSPTGPDEMCLGCHVDQLGDPPVPIDCSPSAYSPSIEDMEPQFGTCEDIITIRGYNFGDEALASSRVTMNQVGQTTLYDMAVITDWTDTLLKVRIPCFTLPANGNYEVRVWNQCGNTSNAVRFAYGSWVSLGSLSPCATDPTLSAQPWITVSGANLQDVGLIGSGQDQGWTGLDAQGVTAKYGVHRTIEFVSSQFPYTGPLVATQYQAWSTSSVQVKFSNFFVDDFLAPESMFPDNAWDNEPESRRDHILDVSETSITGVDGIAMGNFEVYVVNTYYEDRNSNATLDAADKIFQIVTSDPEEFELTSFPLINAIRPRQQEPTVPTGALMSSLNTALGYVCPANCIKTARSGKIRIYGNYYGPSQMAGDQVRLGDYRDIPDASAANVLQYNAVGSDPYVVDYPTAGVSLRIVNNHWANDMIEAYLYPEVGEPLRALYGPDLGIGLNWLNTWVGVWVVKNNCGAPGPSNVYPIKVLKPLPD